MGKRVSPSKVILSREVKVGGGCHEAPLSGIKKDAWLEPAGNDKREGGGEGGKGAWGGEEKGKTVKRHSREGPVLTGHR